MQCFIFFHQKIATFSPWKTPEVKSGPVGVRSKDGSPFSPWATPDTQDGPVDEFTMILVQRVELSEFTIILIGRVNLEFTMIPGPV